MNERTIQNLQEALKLSPKNVPLRLLLAETFLAMNRLDEAEKEFTEILSTDHNAKARFGLAEVFFRKANYPACNVILEELLDKETENNNIELLSLYAKALLREGSIEKALEVHKKIIDLDANFIDEELDSALRTKNIMNAQDEVELDDRFLQRPNIDFSDVGGMETVKKEIELKIIQPLQYPELYKSYGKKIGGGILLHGPPGCGKTYLAKATAGEVSARFISISLNDILDMWIGGSEKNLHEIFELARKNTPCVLFIDEIDALGASRSDMKRSSGRHLINQFLQELDGIDKENEGVLIIGATNTPWNLDQAFRRPGRFDRIIFVPPPNSQTRTSILDLKLRNKPSDKVDIKQLAKKTEGYSGADMDAIIDMAIESKLEASFEDGIPKPIDTKSLLDAIKRHHPSTKEWFTTAKNYAMFANDAGLYDDILKYLKIKKP